MSFVRIALRIAAVEALRGQTFVGGNVLDSEIGSFEVDEDRPFIAVYTDTTTTEGMPISIRPMVMNGRTDIVFETGFGSGMAVNDSETDAKTIPEANIAATDRAFEFYVDFVIRQIGDALTDPQNEWAQIYQGFIAKVDTIQRFVTGGTRDNVRIVAHQMRIAATLIADPAKGEALREGSIMAKFIAKASTLGDPQTMAMVDLIQAHLAGSEFTWQATLRRYGLLKEEGDALLVTTPVGAEPDVKIHEINAAPAEIVQ